MIAESVTPKERLLAVLGELWPGKFTDGELPRWANRFAGSEDEAIEALYAWKENSRFVPKPTEIEKKLVIRDENRAAARKTEQTLAQLVRNQRGGCPGMLDWEVLVRHFRAGLRRHMAQADQRMEFLARLPADHPTRQQHDAQAEGARRKAGSDTRNHLAASGISLDWCDYFANAVMGTETEFEDAIIEGRKGFTRA